MVVGICADGICIKPDASIPRKTVKFELMENGYTPDKISITYKENRFYDIDAFIQWVYEQYHNYQGEALTILDGFGPHDYDDLKSFFSRYPLKKIEVTLIIDAFSVTTISSYNIKVWHWQNYWIFKINQI